MHEDFEQVYWGPEGIWITLCTCGKAFWDKDSQVAYDAWADHEVND